MPATSAGTTNSHPALKIRLVRVGDRIDIEAEEILVVLGAHHLDHRAALDAAVALDRVPRRRERARILHMRVDLDALAAVDDAEALGHVKLLGMRGAEGIDERARVEPDGIDHEGVAVLVMPDRLAEP